MSMIMRKSSHDTIHCADTQRDIARTSAVLLEMTWQDSQQCLAGEQDAIDLTCSPNYQPATITIHSTCRMPSALLPSTPECGTSALHAPKIALPRTFPNRQLSPPPIDHGAKVCLRRVTNHNLILPSRSVPCLLTPLSVTTCVTPSLVAGL
ncbi:uncharacterized protein M421DRAFT_420161 [Didymella exigua CBS 183.55]|uniref:Uncharacterized protein n=1 Tax=Didymella exigua CBS 183.55 TaxID=1150837 RepID=A0A6A5RNB5_9PLEO|nr:uncharacterized protein M421DRAFT_420161 [Didymella exigua CBS 183.55]KAF1928933.1 hypothetical protein M421DRAFT_420161 [Didymella exigua CBS 183.55]